MKILRIASRKSPLALWQTYHVRDLLLSYYPRLQIDIIAMTTQGDRILDAPLAKIGGKGLFVKELEHGLHSGQADIAVHSMKDVPVELDQGLEITAIMQRENPHDALVSNHYSNITDLPLGAKIGTSSLRRHIQLRALRPDLTILDLRGNVNTRLKKLDDGEYDAIILAAAGLIRLGLPSRITKILTFEESLPAIGQGAIGIECRSDSSEIRTLIAPLHDAITATRITAERALNAHLNGGCQVPIAAHAELINDNELRLRALVGSIDGSRLIRGEIIGQQVNAAKIGIALAENLILQGATEILGNYQRITF